METTAPRTPLTILAVEDNSADVYFIRRVLDAHGLPYDLQVIENRQDTMHFFDQLAQQEPSRCPDILLLDLYLPGLDSRALLQRIKALPQCAGLRVVIMTGSDDPTARAEARALGADAFFQKPLSFQAFMQLGDIIKALVFGNAQGERGSHQSDSAGMALCVSGHRLAQGYHPEHSPYEVPEAALAVLDELHIAYRILKTEGFDHAVRALRNTLAS